MNTEIEFNIFANLLVLAAGAKVARGGKVAGAVEGELSARRVALELAREVVVDLREALCVAPPILMGAEGGGERVEVVDGAGELGAGRPRSMVSTATSTSLGLPPPMGRDGARIWCECDEDEEGGEVR